MIYCCEEMKWNTRHILNLKNRNEPTTQENLESYILCFAEYEPLCFPVCFYWLVANLVIYKINSVLPFALPQVLDTASFSKLHIRLSRAPQPSFSLYCERGMCCPHSLFLLSHPAPCHSFSSHENTASVSTHGHWPLISFLRLTLSSPCIIPFAWGGLCFWTSPVLNSILRCLLICSDVCGCVVSFTASSASTYL